MEGIKRVGCEFYHYHSGNGNGNENASVCSGAIKPSFPSVEILKFEHMGNWENGYVVDVDVVNSLSPRLQEIYMSNCPKLIGKLPKQLRSLKKLEIVGCPLLLSDSVRAPAINEFKIVNYGKFRPKRPADGFTNLQTSEIGISEWEELPRRLQKLIIRSCDSIEQVLEEGMLHTSRSTFLLLQSLRIEICQFSRPLRTDWSTHLWLYQIGVSSGCAIEIPPSISSTIGHHALWHL